MKKIKRMISLMLVMGLALSVTVTSFAETAQEPSASDTAAVYVYNVEAGVTVTAYQILYATYDSKGNGLTGYEIATALNGYELTVESPGADEITTIAADIYDGNISGLTSVNLTYETFTGSGGDQEGRYTADLAAGMWIILVHESGITTYNPMVVSSWYTDANDASSLVPGYVDADGYFVEAEWTDSSDDTVSSRTYTENATLIYAKSSPLDGPDKEITNYTEDSEYGTESEEGAAYNIGDTVSFKITTTMPDYSDAYIKSQYTTVFTVYDNLSAGFDSIDEDTIAVYVGGEEYDEYYIDSATGLTVYNYVFTHTVNSDGSQYLEFAFTEPFIDDHPSNSIVITYDAVLNGDALVVGDTSADANTNETGYIATHDPGNNIDTDDYGENDTVYIYTFSITDEIAKVTPDGTASADGNTVTVSNPLADAEFTIYKTYDSSSGECSDIYTNSVNTTGVSVSDSDGYVSFSGLSEGTYYITETESPDDYMINDTVYKIVISAEYDSAEGSETEGMLTSYTILVTDLSSGDEYENTYDIDYGTVEESRTFTSTASGTSITYTWYEVETITVSAGQNPLAIVDPDLIKLPSTGGIGIYAVMAVSVLILAFGVFVVLRKKKDASKA